MEQHDRREFLTLAGASTAFAITTLALPRTARAAEPAEAASPGTYAPLDKATLQARRTDAYALRADRARHWRDQPVQVPVANDDERIYAERFASFSRALPHDALGHPDPAAFDALVAACRSGRVEDFDAIPLGGAQPLRNPQSGLCFDFCGADSHQTFLVPPAPPFASAWRAGEAVEVYWAALLRDVPFPGWGTDPLVAAACADLSALSDYRGPKESGAVTPATIFRGPYPGCEAGPWLSQFLLQDVQYGAQFFQQRVRTFAPGIDYLTVYGDWLARQNGSAFGARAFDPTARYLRSLRDIAAWVDTDPPSQAGEYALAILLGMGTPRDAANPYGSRIANQDAFTTFGPVEWFDLMGRAPRPAHEAVWMHKWRVHRTLRPEEYGGRVHNHKAGAFAYPLHADVLDSAALDETYARFGTYLLPQAYPDGAPMHPAYPSGHSVGSGSTITMLKALFDEAAEIVNPVEPSADGLGLVPYTGPALTVAGELNKLAWNIGWARCAGGIHWRSDVVQGNTLGEAVSMGILSDMKAAYNEPYDGYTLTKLDGTTAQI